MEKIVNLFPPTHDQAEGGTPRAIKADLLRKFSQRTCFIMVVGAGANNVAGQ